MGTLAAETHQFCHKAIAIRVVGKSATRGGGRVIHHGDVNIIHLAEANKLPLATEKFNLSLFFELLTIVKFHQFLSRHSDKCDVAAQFAY